jgi:putative ABC transport system permease protein
MRRGPPAGPGWFIGVVRLTLAGIVLAFGLTGAMAGLLFGVQAWDPLVFATVPAVLGAVALFAAWAPARRASRVDLIQALRYA